MEKYKLLGLNIKKIRKQNNISQNSLAEMVDLSREYIADIERGHKKVSLNKLFEIAKALNVGCYDLINFK